MGAKTEKIQQKRGKLAKLRKNTSRKSYLGKTRVKAIRLCGNGFKVTEYKSYSKYQWNKVWKFKEK